MIKPDTPVNHQSTLSRRRFIAGTSGLTFMISIGGFLSDNWASATETPARNKSRGANITVWVKINSEGMITILNPSAEMGQGSMTALAVLIAEEMDADWSKVRVEQSPIDPKIYGRPGWGGRGYHMITVGSMTVRGYFMPLRQAGAKARYVLLKNAAMNWKVPLTELKTEPGMVIHRPTNRRMSYGEITSFAKTVKDIPEIPEMSLKRPEEFRLIGKFVPRIDIPEKVDGSALYSMDVIVPNMLYATILRTPVNGNRPMSFNEKEIVSMPGIQKIVPLEHGVGILGKRYEDLLLAKRSLKVNWSQGASAEIFDSEKILEGYAKVASSRKIRGHILTQKGDVDSVLQKAHRTYSADYLSDHVYHAQMEPLNAIVAVNPAGDGAEIWAGTQSPTGAIKEVAQLLGTSPRKIKLHPCFLGGGFGRRSMSDYIVEAAELSKAVRKPVKLIWSREDDLQYGAFRPMCLQRLDAGVDADGNLIAWKHSIIGDGRRLLSSGAKTPYYEIPNQHIEIIGLNHGVRLKHWRAVGHGFTKFAIESFIDEIAVSEGVDPYQFHRQVMRNSPRALKVLETAADLAGWGRTPSEGHAFGISFAERSGSMAACVAEVSVERSSGKIRVHRIWSSLDAGIVVQPDNAVAQMESAIIYGLSSVLSERVTFKDGKVQQSNFHNYRVMRMADVPEEIHVKLIVSNESPTGIGETGLPITGGAVANAVAALSGIRLRHLPFTPERVKKAIES